MWVLTNQLGASYVKVAVKNDNHINNNTNYNVIECVFALGNVGGGPTQ